jgi:hypothetical protein
MLRSIDFRFLVVNDSYLWYLEGGVCRTGAGGQMALSDSNETYR